MHKIKSPMLLTDLQTALRNLRATWPHPWPGLPRLLDDCLQQLGHGLGRPASEVTAPIWLCMQALAQAIESDGQARSAQGLEPAYHNRLHMADALLALTALLLETRGDPASTVPASSPTTNVAPADIAHGARIAHNEWLAMLAMLGHDFLHDGTVNTTPSELEWRSVRQLQPLMAAHGMSAGDAQIIEHLILQTDPVGVAASHQKIAGRDFSIHDLDCLTVLVQEADILASTLPGVGQGLTQQLAQEWAMFDVPRAEQVLTPKGRLGFLRFGALFSSPASQRLGLGEVRAAQIAQLEAALPAATA